MNSSRTQLEPWQLYPWQRYPSQTYPWHLIFPSQQLHQAAYSGSLEYAISVIEYGEIEDPNIRDERNMTPYDWAKFGESMGIQDDNVVYLFECLAQYKVKDVLRMFKMYMNM